MTLLPQGLTPLATPCRRSAAQTAAVPAPPITIRARTCGTKLYYRKLRYPSEYDDDPYLEFLADGGYMIETIAKLFFPEGMEVPFDSTEEAIRVTREALSKENVTLFEATFAFSGLLARSCCAVTVL